MRRALLAVTFTGLVWSGGLVVPVSTVAGASHDKGQAVVFVGPERVYHAPIGAPGDPTTILKGSINTLYELDTAISPNGKQIAITGIATASRRHHSGGSCARVGCPRLGVMHADGTHLKWLVRRRGSAFGWTPRYPAWSPDGKTLYFTEARDASPGRHDRLMSVDVAEPDPQVAAVVGGDGLRDASVSPDGETLAAIKPQYDSQGFASPTSLVTLDLSSGDVSASLFTMTAEPLQDPLFEPRWSPDGSQIAVVHVLSCCIDSPDNNITSEILLVSPTPAPWWQLGAPQPRVAATGGRHLFLRWPAWRSAHQLWFTANFASYGDTDNEKPSKPADLYSVHLGSRSVGKPVRRTNTPRRDEQSLSISGCC